MSYQYTSKKQHPTHWNNGFDLKPNKLRHITETIPLADLSGKRIAFDAISFFECILKEVPDGDVLEVWAIGGVSRYFNSILNRVLDSFQQVDIFPIFVFNGLFNQRFKSIDNRNTSSTVADVYRTFYESGNSLSNCDKPMGFNLSHNKLLEKASIDIFQKRDIDYLYAAGKTTAQLAALLHQGLVDAIYGNTFLSLYCPSVLIDFKVPSSGESGSAPQYEFAELQQNRVAKYLGYYPNRLLETHLFLSTKPFDGYSTKEIRPSDTERKIREISRMDKHPLQKQLNAWLYGAPVFDYRCLLDEGREETDCLVTFLIDLVDVTYVSIISNIEVFHNLPKFSNTTWSLLSLGLLDTDALIHINNSSYRVAQPDLMTVEFQYAYHYLKSLNNKTFSLLNDGYPMKAYPPKIEDNVPTDEIGGPDFALLTGFNLFNKLSLKQLLTYYLTENDEQLRLPGPFDIIWWLKEGKTHPKKYKFKPTDKDLEVLKAYVNVWVEFFIAIGFVIMGNQPQISAFGLAYYNVVSANRHFEHVMIVVHQLLQVHYLNSKPLTLPTQAKTPKDTTLLLAKIFSLVESPRVAGTCEWNQYLDAHTRGFSCIVSYVGSSLRGFLDALVISLESFNYSKHVSTMVAMELSQYTFSIDSCLGHVITAILENEGNITDLKKDYPFVRDINDAIKKGMCLANDVGKYFNTVAQCWKNWPSEWNESAASVAKAIPELLKVVDMLD
ncbi:hypothetical protein P9112_013111 [Eukaryota sp. TZLM1-RC]